MLKEENLVKEVEKEIISYIQKTDKFEDVVIQDERWEVFYHLTQMRESLFNWYDFGVDSELLELGCELGALTSLFCQRCKKVVSVDWAAQKIGAVRKRNQRYHNHTAYAGDARDMDINQKYDYIILMPAYYGRNLAEWLDFAKSRLKKSGTLLFVASNKIGVDMIAGKTFEGEVPFAAFGEEAGLYFSHKELEELIVNAGYHKWKFYYPLPDYRLPQEIYSQDYLPVERRTDRVLNYYPKKATVLFSTEDYMSQIIKNNIFEACASSFLVECKENGETSGISYAALSTDREKNAAYATKIYGKTVVRKCPLFDEGIAGIRRLYENMDELRQRGVPVIEQNMLHDAIQMPYVQDAVLMQFIEENDKNKVLLDRLFDQIYQAILDSSDTVSMEENRMLFHNPNAQWGDILKYAYIDMIPLNCFWINEKMVFFDQEFKVLNCPAKYVLFRALRYTDLSLQAAGKEFDLDYFKEKYHLNDIWGYFLEEEDQFIYQNRNRRLYNKFYEWTTLEPEIIQKNIQKLIHGNIKEKGTFEGFDAVNVDAFFSHEFYEREKDACGYWRWVNAGKAEINLEYKGEDAKECEIEFEIILPVPEDKKELDIYIDGALWGRVVVPAKVVIPITFMKDKNTALTLKGNLNEMRFPGDSRSFYFQFRNYIIQKEPEYVNAQIKEVREIQLGLLERLKKICEQYHLQYFAIYGTLLGAVRNQGYLPWDDDIDIVMPRTDYNRLLELEANEHIFGEPFFVQNHNTDSGIFFGGYSKLRDCNTTGISKSGYRKGCNNGIWIDLFPLDYCAGNYKEYIRQYHKIRFYQRLLFHKTYGRKGLYSGENQWKWYFSLASRLCRRNFLCKKLDAWIQKYDQGESGYVAVLARIMPVERIPLMNRDCFEGSECHKFENTDVRIPLRYDECLLNVFGYDYMLYPDISLRKPHPDIYYNVNASFRTEEKEYRNKEWEN